MTNGSPRIPAPMMVPIRIETAWNVFDMVPLYLLAKAANIPRAKRGKARLKTNCLSSAFRIPKKIIIIAKIVITIPSFEAIVELVLRGIKRLWERF